MEGGVYLLSTPDAHFPHFQEAERRIPINYSNRYNAGNLRSQSYLPFKV